MDESEKGTKFSHSKQINHNHTSYFGRTYFSGYGNSFFPSGTRARVFRQVACKYSRVLELGCGLGDFLTRIADDYSVVAVDISEYACKIAKRTSAKEIIQGDIVKVLPTLADRSFHYVIAFDVLEHISPDMLLNVFRSIHRILVKGGSLLFTVPNISSLARIVKPKDWFGVRDSSHVSIFPQSLWMSLAKEIGAVRVYTTGFSDFPYFKMPLILEKLVLLWPELIAALIGKYFIPRHGDNLFIIATKR